MMSRRLVLLFTRNSPYWHDLVKFIVTFSLRYAAYQACDLQAQ